MAIVVTGATGRLGGLVVQHLLARGTSHRSIKAAGRDRERLAAVSGKVEHVRLDYEDPASLDAAFGRGDVVLFVSSDAPGARMGQHRNVVAAAQRARVGRIVYTSIARAGTVDSVLTPDHRQTERLIEESGIPFSFLRNNLYTDTVAAPKIEQASARNEITAGWGDGRIAGAARTDMAEAAAVVLAEPGHDEPVYEISGSTAWGGYDLSIAAGEILGKPVTYSELTADELDIELSVNDVPQGARDFLVALDEDVRNHLFEPTGEVLEALLGRKQTPLLETLRAALPTDLPQAAPTGTDSAHA